MSQNDQQILTGVVSFVVITHTTINPEYTRLPLSRNNQQLRVRVQYCEKLDSFEVVKGRNALNQPQENLTRTSTTQVDEAWNQMEREEKKAAVHEEISRFNKLPANSSYANHRLRVLNKILSLLSLQRTTSEDEELELLFAGLSF